MSIPANKKPALPQLEHYEVIRTIGEGGMATVYKAMQKSLRRVVAIKEVNLKLRDDVTVIKRFEREAITTSSLSHENIVSIYDFFRHQSKSYLVMEYVGGTDLAAIMNARREMPVEIAALIVLQIIRALEYAHAMGLVHRDIKPGNVIISSEGLVKLTDFGVVQTPNSEGLTLPGTFIGTPRYMSPEQVMGGVVDFRSDIFAVGILFYELVTGEPLFDAVDSTQIFYKVTRQQVKRPSRIRAGLPPAMTRLILRCLKKDPRKRFHSTQQLRRALEAILGDQRLLTARTRIARFLQHEKLVISEGPDRPDTVGPNLQEKRNWQRQMFNGETRGFGRTFAVLSLAVALFSGALWWQQPNLVYSGEQGEVAGLKVNVRPWAAVYIDRRLRETTPFETPIPLRPGYHKITLHHPEMRTRSYEIFLGAGEMKRFNINLRKGEQGDDQ